MTARIGQTACRRPPGASTRHNKPTRAERPTKLGGTMQTQYLIFAGAIAACGIVYLLLKYADDPIAKEIEEAQQYEAVKNKIKKALEK